MSDLVMNNLYTGFAKGKKTMQCQPWVYIKVQFYTNMI